MTYARWNSATQSERELFMRGCGWAYRTVRSLSKKQAHQLPSAARKVISYIMTGNKVEWEEA